MDQLLIARIRRLRVKYAVSVQKTKIECYQRTRLRNF